MSPYRRLSFPKFVEHILDATLWHRKPLGALLNVRGQNVFGGSIKGYPVRLKSNSVPSFSPIQFGIQSALPATPITPSSEMGKPKEILRQQQEQLIQLTQAIAAMHQRSQSVHHGPLLCECGRWPGRFARECNGMRIHASSHIPFLFFTTFNSAIRP